MVELPVMKIAPFRWSAAWMALLLPLGAVQCAQDTSRLTPQQEARLQEEGIVRRADNVIFHYTHDYADCGYGSRRGGIRENREERRASIVVTRKTVLIHKNQKVGIEITPRPRRYRVSRRDNRV